MDIKLHYTESGCGEALILLHGNGESSEYFSGQIPVFSQYFRVIAVDTRGHGRSPRGTAPFTLSRFADDLAELMDSLGVAHANLLGFSDGGNIALLFALRYPGRVLRLVADGANLCPCGVKPRYQLPVALEYALACTAALFDRTAVRRAELLGLMVNEPHIRPRSLGGLRMPVLIIAGDDDMIRDSHTRLIARSIPGAELRILRGSHFVAAENPNEFNSCVIGFLTRSKKRGRFS